MIRAAGPEDEDLVLSLALDFKKNSHYRDEPLDLQKFRELVRSFCQSDRTERIAILSGDTGVLAAATVEKFWSYEKVATEFMFWITPEARGFKKAKELIAAYEYWAKKVGASTIQLVSLNPSLDKMYTRWGYRPVEYAYLKDVI